MTVVLDESAQWGPVTVGGDGRRETGDGQTVGPNTPSATACSALTSVTCVTALVSLT